jgi:acetate kinase
MGAGVRAMTAKNIFCLNSGSSSRKFALYKLGDGGEELLAQGALERTSGQHARLWIRAGQRKLESSGEQFFEPHAGVRAAFTELERLSIAPPDAIGHRIVHGGPDHAAPERITDALVGELRKLVPFAPLHLPDEIAGIEAVSSRFPDLPQVACFDTAFHRAMPEVAERFALPRALWQQGIRRYGFHGISYEYIMQTLGADPPPRIIIAHLGNGASMAAVRGGRPLDTTMGFSPTGGFMMGSRSGDLDPGIIVYLLSQKNLDSRQLEQLVNDNSGLLGVSGISSDMKTLLDRRDNEPNAAQAVQMFCYQVRKQIGALTAALEGLDLLVFTGGIGERAAAVRREICAGLKHLGISLDRERNEANAGTVSKSDSRCRVRVIPTNEDIMIARHTYRVLFSRV